MQVISTKSSISKDIRAAKKMIAREIVQTSDRALAEFDKSTYKDLHKSVKAMSKKEVPERALSYYF